MAVFYLTIIQSPTPVFLLATQSMKSLSPNKSSRQSSANTQLSVENLEPRMMLSTVEIFAAGTSGFEQFELQINGAAVQTFTAGSGIESRNFQSFVFETPETITAGDVSIEFLNDFFDPSTGFDSNLAIDAIVVDGTRFETEAPNVFSTGTFLAADGVQPGFRQSETLHANGLFQFADGAGGGGGGSSDIRVRARGIEGGEQFNLLLGGQVVQTFTTSTTNTGFQNFNFTANFDVSLSDVSIEFFGDQFDPSQGIDTDLEVNFIEIDGQRFQTEASTTFSTGTYANGGVTPGFFESQILHTNGVFSFGAGGNTGGGGGDTIQVVARGDEGFEQFVISSNGVELGSGTVSTQFQTFTFNTNGFTAGSDLRIDFVNDVFDPGNGIDTNLIVDSVTINGDTRQVEDASTFGFGTFIDSIGGFAEGFHFSETLHTTGFFEVDFSGNNTGGGVPTPPPVNPSPVNPNPVDPGTTPVGPIPSIPGVPASPAGGDIAFTDAGTLGFGFLSSTPTSLQFGPDGRLYVAQLDGTINAFTLGFDNGQFFVTDNETITLVRDIQNHNDDGSLSSLNTRQVTGLVVAGTAQTPVLYVSSSDPRVAFNGEANLDTNSGTITRLTRSGNGFEAVDIVRGLPRSEENHSINGLTLSNDGNSLFVSIGGNTNNGAPSEFFSFLNEFALSGTILEIDLQDINSRPVLQDFGPGQNGRLFVYDLPTLDDPNVANVTDGVGEDANGLDENGPFGGNDGLNQAILPADAPLRIFADGLRNAFDLVTLQNGQLFTIDNGGNAGLGGDPLRLANGAVTGLPNGGGDTDPEPLFLVNEGDFFGHPNPTRANQEFLTFVARDDNGNPDSSLAVNTVSSLAALVPDSVNIQDGFIIDPSRFTDDASRLGLSGFRIERDSINTNAVATLGTANSSNGLVEFTDNAFGGQLQGDLLVAQFGEDFGTTTPGGVVRVDLNPNGSVNSIDSIQGLENLNLPLDVTVGPDGTVFVAEFGGGGVRAFIPTANGTGPSTPGSGGGPGQIVGGLEAAAGVGGSATDVDGDGLANNIDPFSRDASNGANNVISAGNSLNFGFTSSNDSFTGPVGFGGGLTGLAVNGAADFEQADFSNIVLDPSNGGSFTINNVSNGDAFVDINGGEFLFQTGVTVADNVNRLNVQWLFNSPGDALGQNFQQLGGFIGTGDQSNYLKFVAISHPEGEFELVLEDNDNVQSASYLQANDLFDLPAGTQVVINLSIDVNTGVATPTATYNNTTVTGANVNLAGSAVLDAIQGNHTVNGLSSGLAVGVYTSNTGAAFEDTFSAQFNNINVSAT